MNSKEVKAIGKQILEDILRESNLNFKITNIRNVDYILSENIGMKVSVRYRKGQTKFKDSVYPKKNELDNFKRACKDNHLIPYFCYVQMLENYISIYLFALKNAEEEITDSGLNIKIYDNDVNQNICVYDGVLWKYKIQGELVINSKLMKENIILEYSGEEEIRKKLKLDKSELLDSECYKKLEEEINLINSLENLNGTEKEQMIKVRIGQSKLRSELIKKECSCKICGLNDERFLIASHIKKWSASDNSERVDINNAFLLCPDHDWLFDKFYISFDDEGNTLLSNNIDKEVYIKLNISEMNKIIINDKNKEYLQWHRKEFYNRNSI